MIKITPKLLKKYKACTVGLKAFKAYLECSGKKHLTVEELVNWCSQRGNLVNYRTTADEMDGDYDIGTGCWASWALSALMNCCSEKQWTEELKPFLLKNINRVPGVFFWDLGGDLYRPVRRRELERLAPKAYDKYFDNFHYGGRGY